MPWQIAIFQHFLFALSISWNTLASSFNRKFLPPYLFCNLTVHFVTAIVLVYAGVCHWWPFWSLFGRSAPRGCCFGGSFTFDSEFMSSVITIFHLFAVLSSLPATALLWPILVKHGWLHFGETRRQLHYTLGGLWELKDAPWPVISRLWEKWAIGHWSGCASLFT